MFIRFKRVKLSDKNKLFSAPSYSVHLVVVESFRLKGKPRQRVLKYLGSIKEMELRNPTSRKIFLKRIEKKIDEMDISPIESARLKVSLIRKSIQFGRSF
jgi:hypothetical protein